MKALQGIEGQLEWAHRAAPACAEGGAYGSPPPGSTGRTCFSVRGTTRRRPGSPTFWAGVRWRGQRGEWPQPLEGRRPRLHAAGRCGGMAEEVVVDARHALPVPDGLSLHEAAVIPEVYATAWLNLYRPAPCSRATRCCCTPAPVAWVRLRSNRAGLRQSVLGQRGFGRAPGLLRVASARRAACCAANRWRRCAISHPST